MTVRLSPSARRCLTLIEATPGLDGHAISARAHVTYNSFKNHIRPLLISEKLVHIGGWNVNAKGWPWALYYPGDGEQAPYPPNARARQAERLKEWKDRTGYDARKRADRRASNVKMVDPVLAALMGQSFK